MTYATDYMAPWTALPALLTAPVSHLHVSATLRYIMPGPDIPDTILDLPVESLDIVEDMNARPFTHVTLTTPDRTYFTHLARGDNSWRGVGGHLLRIAIDYEPMNVLSQFAHRVIHCRVSGVEDTGAALIFTATSWDYWLDYPHFGPPITPPNPLTDPIEAFRVRQKDNHPYEPGLLHHLTTWAYHPTRPALWDAGTLAAIAAGSIEEGMIARDYFQGLIDSYPNAYLLPDRRETNTVHLCERATPTEANSIDYRAGAGLVLKAPTIAWTMDNWANLLTFTARWRDLVTGEEHAETRSMIPGPTWPAPIKTVTVEREWKPPGGTLDSPEAQRVMTNMLERTLERSWVATLEAKPAVWVRPGDPARVTDDLFGIVTATRLTWPGNVHSITVRPI